MSDLITQSCKPCEGGTRALDPEEARALLGEIDSAWTIDGDNAGIEREFRFRDYYQTIAFVNALAWIAHREDHHPDLTVGYNRCRVRYSTHAIGGLSRNDFICAAKIDQLLAEDG